MSCFFIPFCVAMIVASTSLFFHWGMALNHDLAWLMMASERLFRGGEYGIDFAEPVSPAGLLLYMPTVFFHRWGLSWIDSLRLYLAIFHGVLAGFCGFLAMQYVSPQRVMGIILFFSVLLFMDSAYDFGQKDSLSLMLAFPYGLCLCFRLQGIPFPCKWLIVCALLAAFGALVKTPMLILFPSLLVLYFRPRAIEVWACFLGIGLGGLAILWLTPEWVLFLQHFMPDYALYNRSFFSMIEHYAMIFLIVLCLCCLHPFYTGFARNISLVLVATAVSASFSGLLQHKGFTYHFVPLKEVALCLLVLACCCFPRKPCINIGLWVFIAGSWIVLSAEDMSVFRPVDHRGQSLIEQKPLFLLVRSLPPTDSWVLLDTEISPFPIARLVSQEWASRYPFLWPLASILREEQNNPLNARSKRDRLFQNLIEDVKRWQPSLIVIRKHPRFLDPKIDLLTYLCKDASFERILLQYEQESFGEMIVLRRFNSLVF